MYEFFKALHIFGLILMAGNVTVTAFWKVFADRTCKTQIIGFAQWLVTVTDFTFTLTGGFLMVIGGYGAALVGGIPLFETPWLVLGQIMLLVSGGIWLLILVPIQIRQARYARDFAIIGDVIPPRQRGRYQGYMASMWGIASIAGPVSEGSVAAFVQKRKPWPSRACTASATLSSTVKSAQSWVIWKERPRPASARLGTLQPVMSASKKAMRPASGVISPVIWPMSVDLPAPLGPMTAWQSLASTLRVT
jgi:uncharacterized membrane protein